MSKQVLRNFTFDAAAGTITFHDFDEPMDLARLALVTDVTTGDLLYNFMDPTKRGSFTGNVLTLDTDTAGRDGHIIRVDYDTSFTDVAYDKLVVGNARTKFRDGFAAQGTVQPNPDTWILNEETPGKHIITQGGNSSGSSYLRISLDPFVESDGLTLTSRKTFQFPMRVGFGISASQRIQGQEFFAGMVAVDEDGNVPTIEQPADKAITGATIAVTSNVGTVTMTSHGFKGGDRVNIFDCADKRMNVGPVVVSTATVDTFTVPITITNGSYSCVGGKVRLVDPLRNASNGVGYLWESTTSTTYSFVARRNGAKFRSVAIGGAGTVAAQTNTNAFTDAFNSTGNFELYLSMDEAVHRTFTADSTGGMNSYGKFTQGIPDEELSYAIQFRARNLQGFTRPIARVVTAAKSGTTTATITTDVPHGLTSGDYVQIYGTRDQTNFANLSGQTAVAATPTPTTFTLIWGSAVTASTTGGAVFINQGQVAAPGIAAQSLSYLYRTAGTDVLTLIGSATWTPTFLPGEYVQLYGLEPAAVHLEGAYKVLRHAGNALELEAPGEGFASINTGGALFRRTDIRLHFSRVMDYTRLVTEIVGGKGNSNDVNGAVPVVLTANSVSQTTGTNSTIWNAAGWGGVLIADHASAALTATTTGGAVTPSAIGNVGSYAHVFHVPVTAVSGTNPTMDVAVEESPDNGTNWFRVYEFPRITAVGSYVSPMIRATVGTRYRYVRIIGGTSPSFTHAVNRIQHSQPGEIIKQFFDRTISLTTLNSATPSYIVDGCNVFQTTVSLGAATTAPVLQLQGSEDNSSWYNIGPTWTPVANSQTVNVQTELAYPRFARVVVATAGATVTTNWVSLKAVRK